MITGLLKRFLKKLASCKSFSLKITTTILLSIIGCATAFPALAFTIDSATWDGRKLVVEGTDGRGSVVEVFYGYDTPANSTSLGTASVKGSGSWILWLNKFTIWPHFCSTGISYIISFLNIIIQITSNNLVY